MNSESTLNSGESMDTGSQLDSVLCSPTNPNGLPGETSKYVGFFMYVKLLYTFSFSYEKGPIEVYITLYLLNDDVCIVPDGTYSTENIPSHWQHSVELLTRTLDGVMSLNDCSGNFFQALTTAYADLHNIELHLIVHSNNEYIIMDKNKFFQYDGGEYKRENHAFILCNTDNTSYSLLFESFKKYISFFSILFLNRKRLNMVHIKT